MIDTHFHLWDPGYLRYPWLDQFPALNRAFSMADLDAARGDCEIEALVFVQCECLPEQHRQELQWIQSLAERDARIRGIVPWCRIEAGGQIRPEIEDIARDHRVKGVRRILQFEEDPAFCLRPDFLAGLRILGEVGLHFEITASVEQLPHVARMVRECPDTLFLLDHMGNPEVARNRWEPWAACVGQLSEEANVACKVSGLATNADPRGWRYEEFVPYIDRVIQCFGAERVMYAGDWPHSLRAIAYPVWVEVLDRAIASRGGEFRAGFYRENAIRMYRLYPNEARGP